MMTHKDLLYLATAIEDPNRPPGDSGNRIARRLRTRANSSEASPQPSSGAQAGETLLPCECGGRALIGQSGADFCVLCTGCNLRIFHAVRAQAIAAWNTRHPVPTALQQGTEDEVIAGWSEFRDPYEASEKHASSLDWAHAKQMQAGDRMAQRIREQAATIASLGTERIQLQGYKDAALKRASSAEAEIETWRCRVNAGFAHEAVLTSRLQSAEAESKAKDARIGKLEIALGAAFDALYELNPNNYTHEDVDRQNSSVCEAIGILHPFIPALNTK